MIASAPSSTAHAGSSIVSTASTVAVALASRTPAATASARAAVCPRPEWWAMAMLGGCMGSPVGRWQLGPSITTSVYTVKLIYGGGTGAGEAGLAESGRERGLLDVGPAQ